MDKKELYLPEEYNIESLYGQVKGLVEAACLKAFRQINLIQIIANLLIGTSIVDDEQEGNIRAKYGRGFSVDNLENMRKFYLKLGNQKSGSCIQILGDEEVPFKLT